MNLSGFTTGTLRGGGNDSPLNPEEILQNQAAGSKSPYVQSQSNSLVAWQLLQEDTIEKARKTNKLIFLHIGYKACHYCRMMANDSFANPDIANLVNESFIPVIVDREQRPDIDTIYMNYVQAVSNAGGWPLNLFLTASMEPVFGGTYWPGPGIASKSTDDNEDEILDFHMILKKVLNIWTDQQSRCRKEASEVTAQLREFAVEGTLGTKGISQLQPIAPVGQSTPAPSTEAIQSENTVAVSSELDLDQLEEAYTHIAGTFDPVCGGFGLAPKFLTPPKLAFLLQLGQLPSPVLDVVGEPECKNAVQMAQTTLRKIRDGALRDHVGGTGFSRCSVTPDWSIPNFEKLVVDNALLLILYVEAWKMAGGQQTSEFYDVVMELVDYLTSKPIALSEGGFASNEAADSFYKKGDSDMREGAYYTWTRKELESVVEPSDKQVSAVAAAHWGVLEDGNVDQNHDPNDEFINQNVLRVVKQPADLSRQFNIPVDQVEKYIRTAKASLQARREKERVRPDLDDKIVTAYNGLCISALANACSALKEISAEKSARCLEVAKAAEAFIRKNMWDEGSKVLYRTWRDGREVEGFADDYAYLINGLLDLFKATDDESFLEFADVLQKTQTSLFYDSEGGAFFTTTASAPHTILRLKDGMDTSLPSTNAVSAANLLRLGQALGDDKFSSMARETINAFESEMLQHPWLFPGLLSGVAMARLGGGGAVGDVKYKGRREKA